jgi:hypothetical protein
MITKPTVFILGAGASQPYGFPTGEGLTRAIRGMNKAPQPVRDYLTTQYGPDDRNIDELWTAFYNDFCDAKRKSLDAFIQDRKSFATVGKAAMSHYLLGCESPFKFREDVPSGWYERLMDYLAPSEESGHIWDYAKNKVSFVTFNYDRSLEFFLRRTLEARNDDPDVEVQPALTNLPVIHVYGSLGDLFGNGDDLQPYTGDTTAETIARAVRSISLSTSDTDTTVGFTQAYRRLAEAEQVFFMGFGFDERNVRRLHLDDHPGVKVAATCQKLSDETMKRARRDIATIKFSGDAADCLGFLKEHRDAIMSAEKPPQSGPMIITGPPGSPFTV